MHVLTAGGGVQVADFNLSRAMKGEMIPSSGVINSPEWAAPERLSGQAEYNGRAADVFRSALPSTSQYIRSSTYF